MATVYERVDALELAMSQAQQDINDLETAVSQAAITDSGWVDIPLTNGVQPYADGSKPQVRKIGKVVFVRGACKNVLAAGTIGTIPEGFRPVGMSHNYIQNTSFRSPYKVMTSRVGIKCNGEIVIEGVQDGATFEASKWFPVHTSYSI